MGKLITDAQIKKALRDIKTAGKTAITLSNAAPRGAGRLLLVVKPDRAEWYARHFVDSRKRMTKLGDYPDMPLAEARAAFAGSPGVLETAPEHAAGVTVGEMFDGYLAGLKAARKPSVKMVARVLSLAGESIGRDKVASEVKPADIVAVIKPIYDRGARVQADKFRMYMGAAFRWAMKATHDYRIENARHWGITANPVDSVPRDNNAEGVGNRWLSRQEYFELLEFLESDQVRVRSPVHHAVMLVMLTGQRANEILSLRPGQWNSAERLLVWEKKKNGLPHVLPVCPRAAAILDGLTAGNGGWYFQHGRRDDSHIQDGSALMLLSRYCQSNHVRAFTTRDLRRTWKTLAGEAGLSKVERDALQHHLESDVSSRHYDRYDGLREKRAAVAKWQAWLEAEAKKARR